VTDHQQPAPDQPDVAPDLSASAGDAGADAGLPVDGASEAAAAGPSPAELLAEASRERDEFRDRWQRAAADLQNFRKRSIRDRDEAVTSGVAKVLTDLLPVVDDLDRAAGLAADPDVEGPQLQRGLDLVRRNLAEALRRHGVEEVVALGHPFDPHVHEALMSRPAEDGEQVGSVVEVFSSGFTLNGRVVRPARVVVAQEG
jgi:molecular chaperone GrpE